MPGGRSQDNDAPDDESGPDERTVIALAAAAGVAIENATLHEEAVRRERWLEATAELIARLAGGAAGVEALQLVADRARALAEADVAWVVIGSRPEQLRLSVVAGVPGEPTDVQGSVAEDSLEATVVRTGGPLTIEDLVASDVSSAAAVTTLRWPDLGPAILVPLAGDHGADGVVALAWTPERRAFFHALDPALPTNFAGQAGLALRISRSREDMHRLELFEERERIARDLHDVVIQRLFAIGLSLQGTLRTQDTDRLRDVVDRAVDDLDDTIRDIRRTIFQLGSPGETDAQSEIIRICDRAASALKFRPQVAFEGPVRTQIEPSLVPHLTAALSEILSNAARHACATSLSVLLSARGVDEVVLRVTDNGRGMPQEWEESGLANLRRRAQALGGRFTIGAAAGGGTAVEWRVPARLGATEAPPTQRRSGSSARVASGPDPNGT